LNRLYRLFFRIAYRTRSLLPRPRRRRQGVAVAVWHRGRLLLVRHSYRPGYGLPGGGTGRRESLREAALRELREEVGLDADPDALVPVYTTAAIRVFEYCPVAAPAVTIDQREIVEAIFVDPREVKELPEYVESYLLSRQA
jgi:8-oxo-dGTP pyrophosphatase MutT (NUDIX family)